jgi:predicted metalloprotease
MVSRVTQQQQWGPPQQFGRPPTGWNQPNPRSVATQNGWNQVYGAPGQGGVQPWPQPSVGFQPPRQPNPLRRVVAVMIAIATVAMLGLILVNVIDRPTDVAYQNDDYQVPPPEENPPPLPRPQTEEEAREFVENNPIYGQAMPLPVRCELEPITAGSTDQELETHLNELMACLVRAWEPPTTAAGFEVVRPAVTIYGDKVQTKCGDVPGGNAVYCSADQQVYYSRSLIDVIPDLSGSPWGPDIVLAHEFGHAMQGRTGILISAHGLANNAGDESSEGLELSRRLEVQADCFSGLFLRSTSRSLGIQQSDVEAMETIFVAIGDDTLTGKEDVVGNHGRGTSRLYWGRQGIGSSDIGVCNTFTAPSDQVR